MFYTLHLQSGVDTKMAQEDAGDNMNVQHVRRPFQPLRSAAVAAGVVVFLFVFRPFGLTVDSAAEALVLLGVGPVSFLVMLAIHALPLRRGPWRTVVAFGAMVVSITAYLAAWSQGARVFETGLAVASVAALTAAMVFLWNRGRIPEQELRGRRVDGAASNRPIQLSGESEQEILQLLPDELLFLSANGNYVDVHYRKGDGAAKSMLRSSLAGLAAQVPGNVLVQCHRSHFVNLAVARRIVRVKGRTMIEFDGSRRVPVSRMFREAVLQAISG